MHAHVRTFFGYLGKMRVLTRRFLLYFAQGVTEFSFLYVNQIYLICKISHSVGRIFVMLLDNR